MPFRPPTRLRRAASAVAAAALVLSASALAAVRPPTGDRHAIAFYTRQANAYAQQPGVKLVESGFFFLHAGRGTSVSYWWGTTPPRGYKPASATVLAQVSDGRIVAYLATLRAPKVRRLRVLMSGNDVFTSTTRCWRRSKPSGSPFGTGDRYVFNDGGARFLPLRRGDSSTTVTLTYPWTRGSTATEVDTFDRGSPAPVRITVTVRGSASLTFRKSITPLATTPALPVPPPPVIPRPKPMCHS